MNCSQTSSSGWSLKGLKAKWAFRGHRLRLRTTQEQEENTYLDKGIQSHQPSSSTSALTPVRCNCRMHLFLPTNKRKRQIPQAEGYQKCSEAGGTIVLTAMMTGLPLTLSLSSKQQLEERRSSWLNRWIKNMFQDDSNLEKSTSVLWAELCNPSSANLQSHIFVYFPERYFWFSCLEQRDIYNIYMCSDGRMLIHLNKITLGLLSYNWTVQGESALHSSFTWYTHSCAPHNCALNKY